VPGGSGHSFLAIAPLETVASIEGWYNSTLSFGTRKLIEAAGDAPNSARSSYRRTFTN
jgi:hypothetical protein